MRLISGANIKAWLLEEITGPIVRPLAMRAQGKPARYLRAGGESLASGEDGAVVSRVKAGSACEIKAGISIQFKGGSGMS